MAIITDQAARPTLWAILRDRLHGDYFMEDRFGAYRSFLEAALEAGYRPASIQETWADLRKGPLDPDGRRLILRHDIDSDVDTARRHWEIERELGVKSSYYFRLHTWAPNLMARIAAEGSEVSYHFEELATVAKRRGLRTREEALAALPEAQALFLENISRIRRETGLGCEVVASHGDFANRELDAPNWLLLEDRAFRGQAGVDLEVYDRAFMDHVTHRTSDLPYPKFWKPEPPLEGFRRGEPVAYVLVHPRNWAARFWPNTQENLLRLTEGAAFGFRQKLR